jgi:hypothetical protein
MSDYGLETAFSDFSLVTFVRAFRFITVEIADSENIGKTRCLV